MIKGKKITFAACDHNGNGTMVTVSTNWLNEYDADIEKKDLDNADIATEVFEAALEEPDESALVTTNSNWNATITELKKLKNEAKGLRDIEVMISLSDLNNEYPYTIKVKNSEPYGMGIYSNYISGQEAYSIIKAFKIGYESGLRAGREATT